MTENGKLAADLDHAILDVETVLAIHWKGGDVVVPFPADSCGLGRKATLLFGRRENKVCFWFLLTTYAPVTTRANATLDPLRSSNVPLDAKVAAMDLLDEVAKLVGTSHIRRTEQLQRAIGKAQAFLAQFDAEGERKEQATSACKRLSPEVIQLVRSGIVELTVKYRNQPETRKLQEEALASLDEYATNVAYSLTRGEVGICCAGLALLARESFCSFERKREAEQALHEAFPRFAEES